VSFVKWQAQIIREAPDEIAILPGLGPAPPVVEVGHADPDSEAHQSVHQTDRVGAAGNADQHDPRRRRTPVAVPEHVMGAKRPLDPGFEFVERGSRAHRSSSCASSCAASLAKTSAHFNSAKRRALRSSLSTRCARRVPPEAVVH
jgi:hypothetical protein